MTSGPFYTRLATRKAYGAPNGVYHMESNRPFAVKTP